jgi:gliding motility-associated-like protein
MRYTFVVTPENAQFFYMYNVVTNDPVNDQHNDDASARFEVSVTDQSGGRIECGYFGVNASEDDVLTQGAPAPDGFWRYTGWQEVPVLLTDYIGQTVTIEFRVTDCQYGAHSCYAYFDLRCGNALTFPALCSNLPFVDLCAPDGYDTYDWEQINRVTGDMVPPLDQQCLRVTTPSVGEIYKVNLSTVAGCNATVQDTIKGLDLELSEDLSLCPTQTPTFQLFADIGSAAGVTFSWTSNPAGFTSDEQNPVITTPLVNTTYSLSVTDVGGCSNSGSIDITITSCEVNVELIGDTICEGACATLTANILSGDAPFSFDWTPDISGGNTTSTGPYTVCPTSTTSYEVTVTDDNGATKSATAIIVVNPKPSITLVDPSDLSVLGNSSICLGEDVDYQATGADSYVWSPATGLSTTTGDQVTVSPNTTTNYTVIGENASGCTDTVPFTVTINANPTLSISDAAICEGLSTTLTISGADTYVWSPATGLSSTTGGSVTADPDTTTEYTIVGTTSAGCKDTTEVTVTVNPLPEIVVNDTGMCQGEWVTITASGADSYIWSPATNLNTTTGNQVIASPTANTTYTVQGTSTAGCISSEQVVVTVGQPPVIVVNDASTCEGDSITIVASGANTYVWTPATGLNTNSGAQVNASPLTTTTYTVEGADANGCKRSAQLTVTVAAAPILTVNNAEYCTGSSAALTVSGADSYSWSPAAGLDISTGNQVIANPTSTSEYIVQGTSIQGCSSFDTAVVTVNSLPIIIAGDDANICLGDDTPLNASGATSYLWSGPNLSNNSLSNPIASPTSTTSYIVTGTDVNGCTATDSVLVTVSSISVDAGEDEEICLGGAVILGASGADTYNWIAGTDLSNTFISSPTASPASTQMYIVEGQNAVGCPGRDTLIVTVHGLPTVQAGDDVEICNGDVTTLIASGALTYLWDNAAILTDATGAATNAFPAVTTSFIVEGTDAFGCVNNDTVLITVLTNPIPFVSIVGDGKYCEGDPITFIVYEDKNGGTNPIYEWFVEQPNGTLTSQGTPSGTRLITLTNLSAGDQVYVQMQSDNACVLASNQLVQSNQVEPQIFGYPNPVIIPNVSLCAGEDTLVSVEELSATSNVTYEWYAQNTSGGFDLVTTANALAINSGNGNSTYQITALNTDNTNCTEESGLMTVQVTDFQFDALASPEEIHLDETSTLSAIGPQTTYIWTSLFDGSSLSGETVTVQPIQTTTYLVDGALNGCALTRNVTVTVRQPILVPDAFSPNEDGVNDYFTIMGIDSYLGARIEIFNRWGNIVYSINSGAKYVESPWDGRFNTAKVPTGVYYYTIDLGLDADDDLNTNEPISGSVIVLH